jgi:hypothetical protein
MIRAAFRRISAIADRARASSCAQFISWPPVTLSATPVI